MTRLTEQESGGIGPRSRSIGLAGNHSQLPGFKLITAADPVCHRLDDHCPADHPPTNPILPTDGACLWIFGA